MHLRTVEVAAEGRSASWVAGVGCGPIIGDWLARAVGVRLVMACKGGWSRPRWTRLRMLTMVLARPMNASITAAHTWLHT